MTNSVDPDQLASSEANWSRSTLFAKAGYIRDQQDKGLIVYRTKYYRTTEQIVANVVAKLKFVLTFKVPSKFAADSILNFLICLHLLKAAVGHTAFRCDVTPVYTYVHMSHS